VGSLYLSTGARQAALLAALLAVLLIRPQGLLGRPAGRLV
jgi:hypothetical protein